MLSARAIIEIATIVFENSLLRALYKKNCLISENPKKPIKRIDVPLLVG